MMHLEIIAFYTKAPMQRLQKELSKLRTNLGAAGMILHEAQLKLTHNERQHNVGKPGCPSNCVNEWWRAGSYRGRWDRPSARPAQTAAP